MNNGQQPRRMRGRNTMSNHRRGNPNIGGNPLSKSYESNGPDVKIRGNAQTIAEKYTSLARDAQVSGDYVMAENFYQHAEHYMRLISASQGYFQSRNDEVTNTEDSDIDLAVPFDSVPTEQPTIGDVYQNPRYRQNHNHQNSERQTHRDRHNRTERVTQDRPSQLNAQPDQPVSEDIETFVPRYRSRHNEQTREPHTKNEYQRPRNPLAGIEEKQPVADHTIHKIIEQPDIIEDVAPELPAFLTATRRVAPRKPRPERPSNDVEVENIVTE